MRGRIIRAFPRTAASGHIRGLFSNPQKLGPSPRYIHSSSLEPSQAMAACAARPYQFLDLSRPDFPGKKIVCPTDDPLDEVWTQVRAEAAADVEQEPVLRSFYQSAILSHVCLESALAAHLAGKLGSGEQIPRGVLLEIFLDAFLADAEVRRAVRADLRAARDRDPACGRMVHCLLYFKGFLALQAHRAAHRLWAAGRRVLALFIQSRVSEVFAVDIHPGAVIGKGVMLDHATGIVVGETAVIGDGVSILHNVTLGGTGKESGNRHPKIGDGVLIGAGTQILGNVRIGVGAKIGAGSVVVKEIPAQATAVGNPAKVVKSAVRAMEEPR